MSILIKGMQMPELYETYKINLAKTREGKIVLGMCKIDATSYRPIGEVIELPEHHGRLFDQDDVKAVLYDMPDTKDKWDAIALLEWAIEKRWCIESE